MVHNLTIVEAAHKEAVFSGAQKAQIFLKNLCPDEFRVGDRIIFCYPSPDFPVGFAKVVEVRTCECIEAEEELWVKAGFQSPALARQAFYELYNHLQPHDVVVFVRWATPELIKTLPQPYDDRDQT